MRFWVPLVLTIALAAAQDAGARKNVVGEVQTIDGAAKQLTLKTQAGTVYTVTTDAKTNFLRVGADLDLKKATKIAPTEIGTGDRVLARGPVSEEAKTIAATSLVVMTKADIAKKQESDREEWLKRGVAGTVTSIDPAKHEVSIKIDSIPPKTVVIETSDKVNFRRYASDSVKFSDAKPGTFAELNVGDRMRVLGDKNEDGSRWKAEEVVSGSFRTLAVQVISVDAATNTLKVKDLSSKDKETLTIHVNPDTVVRRMPERMATMMAMRLNGTQAAPGGAQPGGPRGAGGENMQRRPEGAPAEGRGPGGPGGPGGAGGPGGPGGPGGNGHNDLQQMLERLPPVNVADLKAGDALIISSTTGSDRSNLMAITIVAGVEPFLATAPRSAGVVNLGAWNFDIGAPQ